MGVLEGGNGASLDEELVNADQTTNVTGWHVLDGLHVATHHEDRTLDGLLVQVLCKEVIAWLEIMIKE